MNNGTQHPAITPGRTAVITGGANGIGLAAATRFAALGLNVCLADTDEAALASALETVTVSATRGARAIAVVTDVSELAQVERLRDAAVAEFGDLAIVMNNAGIGAGGGPWSHYDGWQKVIGVNLWGVINGVHAFTPTLLAQGRPAAIINTGSKQGITNPPGNTAYNVTKAGIRALTESLAHALREEPQAAVTAHLLIPGFTYTGMMRRRLPEKPAGAWWPEQVADFMLDALARGDFYILCPDNDVSTAVDHKRIRWHADDLIENRPALSRWHPDYAEAFARFVGDD